MRIAVLGAGGVGSYYGGTLARAGHQVELLARGRHLEAVLRDGLEVRAPGERFVVRPTATADPRALGPADLALVAVKTYSLAEVAPAARLLAERGAAVLPLQNGVDAADRLAEGGVPRESLLGGLTQVSVARTAPGVVERRSPFQRVAVGELRGGASERASRVAAAFREAGAEATASEDIASDLWRKFAFIASMAAACGLARAPIGPVREARLGRLLLERLVREVYAVASARGVAVGEEDAVRTIAFVGTLPAAMKPSFLLDLEAGGPTELDDLSGTVSRLGREAGVPTPVHDTATAALGAVRDAG